MPPDQSDLDTATGDANDASTWPSMRYGDLEHLLVELTGGDRRSVVGRFRNLRQMPYPDAIKTGTGNHVEYDLPRVLAFCAAFAINALLIPQSHAVRMVRDIWPELVRGFIAGAVELGAAKRPRYMPPAMSAVVSIIPDGFAPEGHTAATAANLPSSHGGSIVAHLRVDCGMLMAVVAPHLARAAGANGSADAFDDLDRSFGWSSGSVPLRASAADMFAGASFLDRGPYLERADAFLRIVSTLPTKDDPRPARRHSIQSAQNLLDYLGRPSPIDEWKGEIGTEDGRPRLKHFLASVGTTAGLIPPVTWPETILATTGGSASEKAAMLIHRAFAIEKAKKAGPMTAPT